MSVQLDDVKHRYINLRKVYGAMVGTLYPSIAYRDLLRLREEYRLAGGDPQELPSIRSPRSDGSAPPGLW